jgi:hypothetical protein
MGPLKAYCRPVETGGLMGLTRTPQGGVLRARAVYVLRNEHFHRVGIVEAGRKS